MRQTDRPASAQLERRVQIRPSSYVPVIRRVDYILRRRLTGKGSASRSSRVKALYNICDRFESGFAFEQLVISST